MQNAHVCLIPHLLHRMFKTIEAPVNCELYLYFLDVLAIDQL